MSQTKRQSVIESITQQAVGYLVGLGTQYIVFPLFDMEVNLIDNLIIGAIFAIVSTVRSYVLRRVFNKQHNDVDLRTINYELQVENQELMKLLKEDEFKTINRQRAQINVMQRGCKKLQVENKELNTLVKDMREYIHKIDGFPT